MPKHQTKEYSRDSRSITYLKADRADDRGNDLRPFQIEKPHWQLLLLSIYMFAIGLAVGAILGVAGGSAAFIWSLFLKFLITSLLYIFVTAPSILLANVTKGYLAPLGLILIIVILSNVLGSFGFAPYFPWTIPSVFQSTGSLQLSSIIIVAYTGIILIAGTFAWWRYAEQP